MLRCEREVVGDGLADEVTLGPLHTAAGRDRVEALVKDAAAQGATVRTAGRIRDDGRRRGRILRAADGRHRRGAGSALAREEQFGPVLPIFGYDAIDDAVAAANATEFGLTASVWTGDDALADKVTAQLVAGTVSVNCHGMAAQDPRVPFGGVGQSGLGRELGAEGSGRSRSSGLRPPAGAAVADGRPGLRVQSSANFRTAAASHTAPPRNSANGNGNAAIDRSLCTRCRDTPNSSAISAADINSGIVGSSARRYSSACVKISTPTGRAPTTCSTRFDIFPTGFPDVHVRRRMHRHIHDTGTRL